MVKSESNNDGSSSGRRPAGASIPASKLSQYALDQEILAEQSVPLVNRLAPTKPVGVREQTCESIAVIAGEDSAHAAQLVQAGVLPLLAACFQQTESLPLRLGAAGALRNLSTAVAQPANAFLLASNFPHILSQSLVDAVGALNAHTVAQADLGLMDGLLVQLCALILNLVESAEQALEHTSTPAVFAALFSCMRADFGSHELSVVAGQCLETMSEDNEALQQFLHAHPAIVEQVAAQLGNADDPRMQIVSCAILLLTGIGAQQTAQLVEVLLSVIALDLASVAATVMTTLEADAATFDNALQHLLTNSSSANALPRFEASQPVQEWSRRATAVRMAIELLTNVYTLGDEDEPTAVFQATTAALLAHPQLVQVLMQYAAFPDPALVALVGKYPFLEPTVSVIHLLQQRALDCLSNLCLSAPPELGDLTPIWTHFWSMIDQAVAQANQGILVPIVKALWVLAERYPVPVTPAHLDAAAKLCQSTLSAVAAPAFGLLGALGTRSGDDATRATIAQLCFVAIAAPQVAVRAEAFNVVFDLFSEADGDALLASLGGVDALEAQLPQSQQLLAAQRDEMDPAECERVEEALVNCERFVDYKRS